MHRLRRGMVATRAAGWCAVVLLFALAAVTFARSSLAAPYYPAYQINLPPPPVSGDDALGDSLEVRRTIVAGYNACGGEIEYWLRVRHSDAGEGTLVPIIGKMLWMTQHQRGSSDACETTIQMTKGDLTGSLNDDATRMTEADWDDISINHGIGMNAAIKAAFGDWCDDVIKDVVTNQPGGIIVTYHTSRDCMATEIHNALMRMQKGDQQLGSSGLPCYAYLRGTTKGEWDITVRDLTRVLFMGRAHPGLLEGNAIKHIENDLLVADGPPGPASYSPLQCGNQENDTGTAQERTDDSDWLNEAADTIGDLTSWFDKRMALILAVGGLGALVAAAGLGPVETAIAGMIVGVLAVGVAAVSLARIPETENHRLMIETSRYLNNQRISDQISLYPYYGSSGLQSDQKDVRAWLLTKFQSILKSDFEEYNARPYQRYSMLAILNIADFSENAELKTAAKAVLNYMAAKFAAGSSEGRRLVPFRRRMEVVKGHIEASDGMFDLVSGADEPIAFMLFYAGQTQQLRDGRASRGAVTEMVYEASSDFQPEPLVVDLAIRTTQPHYQRIHHDGVEIYSRDKGFLLTAGGIDVSEANHIDFGPVGVFADPDDRGAAVPTTLMFAGATDRTTWQQFIRIDGFKTVYSDKIETFDGNLCVWKGFACGLNVELPGDIVDCLKKGPDGTPDQWRFFDTAQCGPYLAVPRVLVAIYRETACRSTATGCQDNFGFIEAIDAAGEPLETFMNRVVQANPANTLLVQMAAGGGGGVNLPMSGTYHSASGHAIVFDCEAHQHRSNATGIVSVDGETTKDISDWPLAGGDPKAAPSVIEGGDASLTITNRLIGKKLVLDLSDRDHLTMTVSDASP